MPAMFTQLPMYVPTKEFPWPGVGMPFWLPAAANRATFLGMKAPAAIFGRVVDRWRQDTLGLPRFCGRHDPLRRPDNGQAPVLHAFSPSVLPPPADWPDSVHTTGYWVLPPSDEALPPQVEDFLAAGDPPVFVGFGSMSGRDPARTTDLVLDAARRAGTRLVIGAGWGGLDRGVSGDGVLVVEDVDYQRLFPRAAAVVHQGGAGTTGTAFASGRPQVVCPFVADQPFWAPAGTRPRCRSRTAAATPPHGSRPRLRHHHRRHGSGHGTCRPRLGPECTRRGRSNRGGDRTGAHCGALKCRGFAGSP